MVRTFSDRPIDAVVVESILTTMTRVPSAGFTQGTEFLVLEGPKETARYWDACLPPPLRENFKWPGLLIAPLLVVPLACEEAYRARYQEPDKLRAGGPEPDWVVPYWFVDAGFSALMGLLAAVDAGLGACFFRVVQPGSLRRSFGIPPGVEPVGTVAIGHPLDDRPSSSLRRPRREPEELIHRAGW